MFPATLLISRRRVRGSRLTVGLLVLGFTAASAQTQSGSHSHFDVVSVKPCKPDSERGRSGGPPSSRRLELSCRTVQDYIQLAYDQYATDTGRWGKALPIEGGPGWIHSDLYRIEATSETAESEGTQLGAMLRSLLEDRFGLRIRRETRDVPVYELTAGRGPSKLTPFENGSCVPRDFAHFPPPEDPKLCRIFRRTTSSGAMWSAQGVRLDEFCILLASELDRPVVDKTDIAGRFGIVLQFAPESQALADDVNASPPIPTAVEEQLGLRLVSGIGPGEVLVVEQARKPSEN